jgi:hypothetical protein
MAFLRANFAQAVLGDFLHSDAILLTVLPGHTLPTGAGSFRMVIWDAEKYTTPQTDPNYEIVTASFATSVTYNIIRAQEGTTAVDHEVGQLAALHITAGLSEDDLKWVGSYQVDETLAADNTILTVNGSSLMHVPSVVNVMTYGAIGNGTTDDTAAIQNALNDGLNKTIYFPSGIYKTTSTLTVPRYCTIVGDTRQTTLIEPKFNGNCFSLSYGSDTVTEILIERIGISGTKATYTTGHGFYFNHCAGLKFRDCIVGTMGQNGWHIVDGWTPLFENCYSGNNGAIQFYIDSERAQLHGCQSDGGTYSCYFTHKADNVLLQLCHFEGASVAGIALDGTGGTLQRFQINNTEINGTPRGIDTFGGQVTNINASNIKLVGDASSGSVGIYIRSGTSYGHTFNGVYTQSFETGIYDLAGIGYNKFTGCYVTGTAYGYRIAIIPGNGDDTIVGGYVNGGSYSILHESGTNTLIMADLSSDPHITGGTPTYITGKVGGFYLNGSDIEREEKVLFAFTLPAPDDTLDDIRVSFPYSVVITKVRMQCQGSTNVVGRLYKIDSDGVSNKTGIVNSDWTITTTLSEVTSFVVSTIPQDYYVSWDTTSVSGSPTSCSVVVYGHKA